MIEWVGALFSLPAEVTEGGEPFSPEALLWMIPNGLVLGVATARPGEMLSRAASHFHATTRKPLTGSAHVPERVRVASAELAAALRQGVGPEVAVTCAPTPEVEQVIAAMREHLAGDDGDDDDEWPYLSDGVDADAVAPFFRATAALFRAESWQRMPETHTALSLTSEALGLRDAVVSVFTMPEETHRFVVLAGVADFEDYADAIDQLDYAPDVNVPAHFGVTFEPGEDLRDDIRREVEEHRWEVATVGAYPRLFAVDDDGNPRATTATELAIAEAIALALPEVLADKDELLDAWEDGPTFSRTLTVTTHAGPVDMTLRAPLEDPGWNRDPLPDDLFAALAELEEDSGYDIDERARMTLEDALVDRFAASPEGSALADVGACRFVMEYAATHVGTTIASLDAYGLEEVLFDIIPRKVSIEASRAGEMVEEFRAFFAFLKREYGAEHADACLRVLGAGAIQKLESALRNPRNFGIAKSFVMGNRYSLPTTSELPSPRTADPAAARARKNKRKAKRKARKKNR